MKQSNIPVIVFSVIAFLMLLTVVTCAVFITAYHIKYRNEESPGASPSEPVQTTETAPSTENTETPFVTPSPDETQPDPATPTPPPSKSETPSIVIEKPYVLKKTSDAGSLYQDSLTFLGDSTTYHLIKNKVLKDGEDTNQVWFGASGTLSLPFATSNDLFDRLNAKQSEGLPLAEMAKQKHPQILVVTLGAGVSSELSEENFKKAYNAVIDTVLAASPKTKIICQSIYPVCRTGSALGTITNPSIVKANGWISDCVSQQFEKGRSVYYLDTNSVLKDIEGYLPDSYSNGDGIHLTAAAYEIILENIRTHKIPD